MDTSMLVGGGILAGIFATFFQGFRQKIMQLFSVIFVTSKFENIRLIKATKTWLCLECKRLTIGSQNYNAIIEYVQPTERNQVIALKTIPNDTSLWFFHKKPFLASLPRSPLHLGRG